MEVNLQHSSHHVDTLSERAHVFKTTDADKVFGNKHIWYQDLNHGASGCFHLDCAESVSGHTPDTSTMQLHESAVVLLIEARKKCQANNRLKQNVTERVRKTMRFTVCVLSGSSHLVTESPKESSELFSARTSFAPLMKHKSDVLSQGQILGDWAGEAGPGRQHNWSINRIYRNICCRFHRCQTTKPKRIKKKKKKSKQT